MGLGVRDEKTVFLEMFKTARDSSPTVVQDCDRLFIVECGLIGIASTLYHDLSSPPLSLSLVSQQLAVLIALTMRRRQHEDSLDAGSPKRMKTPMVRDHKAQPPMRQTQLGGMPSIGSAFPYSSFLPDGSAAHDPSLGFGGGRVPAFSPAEIGQLRSQAMMFEAGALGTGNIRTNPSYPNVSLPGTGGFPLQATEMQQSAAASLPSNNWTYNLTRQTSAPATADSSTALLLAGAQANLLERQASILSGLSPQLLALSGYPAGGTDMLNARSAIRSSMSGLGNFEANVDNPRRIQASPSKTQEHPRQASEGDSSSGIPMALPSDEENLSQYQCLVRAQIDLFEARIQDIECNAQGRNKPIRVGQVGIRCRHCTVLPPGRRPRGAVYFPAKLPGLYQAAQNMAINHFTAACVNIPPEIKQRIIELKEKKTTVLGGGKQYWANGARVVGIVETDNGLVFDKSKPW